MTGGVSERTTSLGPPAERVLLLRPRTRWAFPVVVGMAVLWSGLLAGLSYFFDEDFLFADYLSGPVSVDTFIRSWFGHLVPGYVAADFVFLSTFGLSWVAAGVIMAAIHAGAVVALVRCLDAAVGRRWLNLGAGLLFAFSIAQVQPAMWWAATLNNLSALAFCLSTMGGLTRWIKTGRTKYLVWTLIAFALAVAFSEKSLLFALFCTLWCVLVLWRDLPLRQRALEFGRHWPAWLGLGGIALLGTIAFLAGPYLAESGPPASLWTSLLFIIWGLVGGFVPSLFGSDLWLSGNSWYSWPVILLSNLLLLLAVVVTIRMRPSTWNVWAFMAVCAVMGQAVLSRRADLIGFDNARVLRYHLEITALFWMGAAVVGNSVLNPSPQPGTRSRTGQIGDVFSTSPVGRHRRLLACLLLAACAVGWLTSVRSSIQASRGNDARAWIDQADRTWPDSDHPFLRFPLPVGFTYGAMYPYNMSDTVLPEIFGAVRFTADVDDAWIVDDGGTAGPVEFESERSVPVSQCLQPGEDVVLAEAAEPGQFLVVRYTASGDGAVVLANGERGELPVQAGPGRVIQYTPTRIPEGSLKVTARGTAVCVEAVDIGAVRARLGEG